MALDLDKLDDSDHLLDILLSIESVLDTNDLYVFANWIDGKVIRGPIVRRHWVTIDLEYPYNRMPDPRGALRLVKHGVQVQFNKVKQEHAGDITHPDYEPRAATDWLITITMPRILIKTTKEADLDWYEDDVDADEVTAAKDIGLDDESSYQQNEQLPGQQAMNPEEGPPPGAPNAPQQ